MMDTFSLMMRYIHSYYNSADFVMVDPIIKNQVAFCSVDSSPDQGF